MRVLLLFLLFPFFSSAQHQRVRFEATYSTLMALAQKGVPVDHLNKKGDAFIGEFSVQETAIIQALATHVAVLIPDLVQYNKRRRLGHSSSSRPTGALPKYFGYGTLMGFLTYDELMKKVDTLITAYPKLISSKKAIGKTIEGRDIISFKISDNPNVDEAEPEVLYTAMHHAREPMSMMQLMYFVCSLLENYKTDTSAQRIINGTELYIIPCVNPDGYIYNEEVYNHDFDGTDYYWRKNRRDHKNGNYGVDLNRNYGHKWGLNNEGSSPDQYTATYRGLTAFSEPETMAMRNFCNERQFKGVLNYHSFSNVLIYPWGYDTVSSAPDAGLFEKYAQLLTADNNYLYGTCYETINYTTNGDANDWMYGEEKTKAKIMAFTPEVGNGDDGFWPMEDRIVPLCEENLSANMSFAKIWAEKLSIANSISSISDYSVSFYPNPAQNEVFFKAQPGTFFIQTLTGQTVLSATAQEGHIAVDGLSPGLYLCFLKTNEGQSRPQKLIINNNAF